MHFSAEREAIKTSIQGKVYMQMYVTIVHYPLYVPSTLYLQDDDTLDTPDDDLSNSENELSTVSCHHTEVCKHTYVHSSSFVCQFQFYRKSSRKGQNLKSTVQIQLLLNSSLSFLTR